MNWNNHYVTVATSLVYTKCKNFTCTNSDGLGWTIYDGVIKMHRWNHVGQQLFDLSKDKIIISKFIAKILSIALNSIILTYL